MFNLVKAHQAPQEQNSGILPIFAKFEDAAMAIGTFALPVLLYSAGFPSNFTLQNASKTRVFVFVYGTTLALRLIAISVQKVVQGLSESAKESEDQLKKSENQLEEERAKFKSQLLKKDGVIEELTSQKDQLAQGFENIKEKTKAEAHEEIKKLKLQVASSNKERVKEVFNLMQKEKKLEAQLAERESEVAHFKGKLSEEIKGKTKLQIQISKLEKIIEQIEPVKKSLSIENQELEEKVRRLENEALNSSIKVLKKENGLEKTIKNLRVELLRKNSETTSLEKKVARLERERNLLLQKPK